MYTCQYVQINLYNQGDLFEKANNNWRHGNTIFLCLVGSVTVIKQKLSLLCLCWFIVWNIGRFIVSSSSFVVIGASKLERSVKFIAMQHYVVVAVNNLRIMVVISQHFFNFLKDKSSLWSKLPDFLISIILPIMRSNRTSSTMGKTHYYWSILNFSSLLLGDCCMAYVRTRVHLLQIYDVSYFTHGS